MRDSNSPEDSREAKAVQQAEAEHNAPRSTKGEHRNAALLLYDFRGQEDNAQ